MIKTTFNLNEVDISTDQHKDVQSQPSLSPINSQQDFIRPPKLAGQSSTHSATWDESKFSIAMRHNGNKINNKMTIDGPYPGLISYPSEQEEYDLKFLN